MTNNELIHLFAQQTEQSKRVNSLTIHNTNKLLSYSQTIANIQNNYCFLIDWNYSVTTGKHNSFTRGATSHYNQIYVHFPDVPNSADNFKYIKQNIEHNLKKLARARKPVIYISNIEQLKYDCERLKAACIDLNLSIEDSRSTIEYIENLEINDSLLDNVKEFLQQQKEKEELNRRDKENRFRTFDINYINSNNILLRIKDNMLETSKGVKVGLNKAKYLFAKYKQYLDNKITSRDLIGRKLDYYKVDMVTNDFVILGCHTITRKELFNVLDKEN